MAITDQPCSKCGCPDTPKYKRMKLRKNGKRTKSVSTYCVLCHEEDQKIREARRYPKKLAYNREWNKQNRDKANASARRHYWKKQRQEGRAGVNMGAEVEWHGHKSCDGFSQLTYTPLYVHGGR